MSRNASRVALRIGDYGVFPRSKVRTCCSSLIISSVSLKPVLRTALLGRTPSAVGYQPLAAEMGDLQADYHEEGIVTSPAVYVPADDLTDWHPQRRSLLSHRWLIAELGIYPAVDPLASNLSLGA